MPSYFMRLMTSIPFIKRKISSPHMR